MKRRPTVSQNYIGHPEWLMYAGSMGGQPYCMPNKESSKYGQNGFPVLLACNNFNETQMIQNAQ